jgi:uncharacterized protein YecE (DUF72 family)
MIGSVRIGTSGWSYRHWQGVLYPAEAPSHQWLHYYAQEFTTVEVNSTFYHLPRPSTAAHWCAQVPKTFQFALKVNRLVTHQHRLLDCANVLARFFEAIDPLRPCLGPLLYQLPPSLPCDLERLETFACLLPMDQLHAFEFRHPSWFTEAVQALLHKQGLIFCIHDWSCLEVPMWTTGPAVYVRLHGPTGRYAGSYDAAVLAQWAKRIRCWQAEGKDVYIYFNNDIGGHAVHNARTLQALLDPSPMQFTTAVPTQ